MMGHRVCMRTQALVKSCVILHGCVFLGSLGGWWHVVRPTLQWVLGYPAADVTNTNTSGQCATTVDVVAGGQSDSCGFQWTPGLQQSLDTLFYVSKEALRCSHYRPPGLQCTPVCEGEHRLKQLWEDVCRCMQVLRSNSLARYTGVVGDAGIPHCAVCELLAVQ
jgi:hypothetical protein